MVGKRCMTIGLTLSLSLAMVPMAGAQVVFDGTLNFAPNGEWSNVKGQAVQDNYTGVLDPLDAQFIQEGSELNQLFVKADANCLYLGITGNLEKNGNAILVFFEVGANGQNILTDIFGGGDDPNTQEENDPFGLSGPPFALQSMEHDQFDANFAPNYALHLDAAGGTGFVNWYELLDPAGATVTDPNSGDEVRGIRTYRGAIGINNGDNTLEGGDPGTPPLSIAFDDTNVAGVTPDSAANAATATTGLEACIPLAHLGIGALPATIRVQAIIVSGGGFVSNQSLPGLQAGTGNLGNGTWFDGEDQPEEAPVNYADAPGDQNAEVALTQQTFNGTIDGQGIPADFTAGSLIATQTAGTQFGDQVSVPGIRRGSEINQLLIKEGLTKDSPAEAALEIGITGNLNTDGTNLIIFFDTVPAMGEATLADNPGRIGANNGDTLPCAVDYAILFNIFAGKVFVDVLDLNNNTSTFLGEDPDFGGDGILENGGVPVEQWRAVLNNSNLDGVNETPGDDPQEANALTATTGFEISVPLSQIGSPAPGSQINVLALLTGANEANREIANQILPAGLGGGLASFGDGPTDLTDVSLPGGGTDSYSCMPIQIGPTCNEPRFDTDGDGDVDQEDFGVYQACITGQNAGPVANACECYDWNGLQSDGDIDQEDFGIFQLCASGPEIPATIGCDEPLN